MIQSQSLARPYARGAFEYGFEQETLPAWSHFLKEIARRVQDPLVVRILKNPFYSNEVRGKIVTVLAEGLTDGAGVHFIQLLAINQRLALLPQISILFEELYAELQKNYHFVVTFAVEMKEGEVETLKRALARRMGFSVTLSQRIDPTIIGGFVVQMKDHVINASIKGQLEKLRDSVAQ